MGIKGGAGKVAPLDHNGDSRRGIPLPAFGRFVRASPPAERRLGITAGFKHGPAQLFTPGRVPGQDQLGQAQRQVAQ
jgi:hypothetical protein